MFTKDQTEFIKKHIPSLNLSGKLSDADYVLIEDKIGDLLVEEEQNNPQSLSPAGKLCESILLQLA